MTITVINPAASTALTTLTAVKLDLGITGNDEDPVLTDLIGQASASLAGWIGRPLARETVTETFRLTRPEPSLCLSRFPVASVTSVTIATAVQDSATIECDRASGILYRLNNSQRYLAWPADVVAVEYAAGWLLPGQDGRDLPADIEAAAIALVRRAYHAAGRDPALKAMDVGSGAVKLDWYIPSPSRDAMPPEAVPVVDRYRVTTVG